MWLWMGVSVPLSPMLFIKMQIPGIYFREELPESSFLTYAHVILVHTEVQEELS